MDGAQSDDDLVACVAQGEHRGLEILYDRYSRLVFSLVLRILGDRQGAEDLTQEVFFRVWQQAGTYHKERGRFRPWLMGITHHMTIDEIRRRKSRPQQVHSAPESSLDPLEVADRSPEPEELTLEGIRRQQIREALIQLPEVQREVIELSYFGGLTQTQIAQQTGEPLGTIKTRARLALQRLRANLQSRGVSPDML